MDAFKIEEDDNVTIEIEIDEMLKEFEGVEIKIKYKNKIIKELHIEGSIRCID